MGVLLLIAMYSLSFRKKVLRLKEEESLSFDALGKRFAIHPRTIQRWKERIEPCLKRNKPATKIDMEKLKEDVKERPDDYQWERAERFGVTTWGIGLALRRLAISYKKNPVSSQGRHGTQGRVPRKDKAVY
jgi:transposase